GQDISIPLSGSSIDVGPGLAVRLRGTLTVKDVTPTTTSPTQCPVDVSRLGGHASGVLCNPLLPPDVACAGLTVPFLPDLPVVQWTSNGSTASLDATIGAPPSDGLLRVTVDPLLHWFTADLSIDLVFDLHGPILDLIPDPTAALLPGPIGS